MSFAVGGAAWCAAAGVSAARRLAYSAAAGVSAAAGARAAGRRAGLVPGVRRLGTLARCELSGGFEEVKVLHRGQ